MSKKVTISAKGKKPISFNKGALHRQLGVPEGQPIPAAKKQAALSGKLGPLAKKRASFAFKGALAAGRNAPHNPSPPSPVAGEFNAMPYHGVHRGKHMMDHGRGDSK